MLQEIANVIAEGVKGALTAIEDFINGFVDAFEGVIDAIAGGDDLPTTAPPPKGDVGMLCAKHGLVPAGQFVLFGIGSGSRLLLQMPGGPEMHLPAGSRRQAATVRQFRSGQFHLPARIAVRRRSRLACLAQRHADGPEGPVGAQTDWRTWLKCMPCEGVANAVPLAAGVCGCAAGYQPFYQIGPSGKKTLTDCRCPEPMKEGYFFGNKKSCQCPSLGQVPRMSNGKLVCACPDNFQLEGGLCRACTATEIYDFRNSLPACIALSARNPIRSAAATNASISASREKSCKAAVARSVPPTPMQNT